MIQRRVLYTPCTLTADWWESDDPPEVGMFLITDAGSTYQVWRVRELTARETPRYRLDCTRVSPDDVAEDARVARWSWGARRRSTR